MGAAMNYLVVDDHTLIREALQAVLQSLDPQGNVLEAGSAAQARALVAADPRVDLAAEPRTLKGYRWILPFTP